MDNTQENGVKIPLPQHPYVAVGFDGYVDTLVRPVKKIIAGEREHFPTIQSFGQYLASKSSLSCSIDLNRQTEKPGGNTPLFAAALSSLGAHCYCVGAFGYPKPHPAFAQLGKNITLEGVANPGSCNALEFSDGKIMMACNGDIDQFYYALLNERCGSDRLLQWLENAQAAAFLNWSEMPGSTSIWQGLLDDVLPHLSQNNKKWLLLDISDCSRRDKNDIQTMLEMIRRFSATFKIAFSLNHNEAMVLCDAMGISCATPEDAARKVYEMTHVNLLALHLLDGAWGVDDTGCWMVPNIRVRCPALSTGGGDNFNAGLLYALLEGKTAMEAVTFANRVSSLYVQNGRSPILQEIVLTPNPVRN